MPHLPVDLTTSNTSSLTSASSARAAVGRRREEIPAFPQLLGDVRRERRHHARDRLERFAQRPRLAGPGAAGHDQRRGHVQKLHDRGHGRVEVHARAEIVGHAPDGLVRFPAEGERVPRGCGPGRGRSRSREQRLRLLERRQSQPEPEAPSTPRRSTRDRSRRRGEQENTASCRRRSARPSRRIDGVALDFDLRAVLHDHPLREERGDGFVDVTRPRSRMTFVKKRV